MAKTNFRCFFFSFSFLIFGLSNRVYRVSEVTMGSQDPLHFFLKGILICWRGVNLPYLRPNLLYTINKGVEYMHMNKGGTSINIFFGGGGVQGVEKCIGSRETNWGMNISRNFILYLLSLNMLKLYFWNYFRFSFHTVDEN